MGAHFIFLKAHAPQGGDKGSVTDGLLLGSQPWKHQATTAGEFAQFSQNRASLGAQRHKVVEAQEKSYADGDSPTRQ